jgi:hypothetical protein
MDGGKERARCFPFVPTVVFPYLYLMRVSTDPKQLSLRQETDIVWKVEVLALTYRSSRL